MDEFEFTNTDNIAQDLMDIKETARIKKWYLNYICMIMMCNNLQIYIQIYY